MNREAVASGNANGVDVVASHFDDRAKRYAEKYAAERPRHLYEHEKRERASWAGEWISRFAQQRPVASCLDVGCGDGRLLRSVLAAHERWTGTGIDVSPGMIETARRHAEPASAVHRAAWSVGSLDDCQQMADVVVSLGVIGYQADQPAFLTQLASRVLPGGLLILSVANGRSVLRSTRTIVQRAKDAWRRGERRVRFGTLQLRMVDQLLKSQELQRVELRWLCFGLGLPRSDLEVRASCWCEHHCTNRLLAERLAQVVLVCYQRS